MDGQIRKRRTLEAIKRIILRESLNQPLMVIFEDLHWIDEATQEFLNLLADSIGTAKILLLVNYRPEYSHQWNSKTYYTQLRLDPLAKESAEEMLATLLGVGDELAALKRLVIEKTEGNPFFIEEMVLALFDQGALVRDGTVKLVRYLASLKIPATVQGVLAARIDRLPAEEKDLLQTLAVMGREFPLALVRHVVLKSDDDLNRILGDLQLGEFIYEQPATGDIEYIFKHALTQEVAYNSLLSDRRKSVHEQVGLSIELCFASSLADHYDELAHHFQRSGNVLKALEYLLHAGQQATHRLAYIESKELFGRALELVAGLKPTVDRDRTESLVRLNLAISTIFNEVGTFMDAGLLASLERAHTLCEELGRDTHHCDVLSALAFLYANRAETDKTREVCEELLAIATELGDTDLVGRAHFWAGFSALWSGDFIVAMKSFDQAYELPRVPRSRQELSYGGWQPRTRVFGALALIVRGFPDRALARYEEAEALVREEMDPSLAFPMLAWSAYLNIEIGNPERALKASEEGSRLATQDNVSAVFALYKLWRARSLVQLGKIEQGIDEMVRLKGIIMAYAATAVGSTILPAYVEACLIARRRTEGLEAVSRGLEIVEIIKTRFAEAELYRLKGDLLLLGGRQWENEAEESFRKAITIARSQTAKWWELRSTVRLARVLRITDRNSEARAMLAEIYHWFTEGFDTADLKDAKALLEELNS
jgi:tetratricopeptide (TPR) repeat protein